MRSVFRRMGSGAAKYGRLVLALAKARSSYDLALPLLPILAKYGLAWPAAHLIHRTIRPITAGPAPHRVLVIEKAVFLEDILEVLGDLKEVQTFGVKRAVLKSVALGVLPRDICADDKYVSDDPAHDRAKLQYRALWKRIWHHLSKLGRYDAILTGNWCYWAERELATVLEEIGTPFLVLHKEGIKPPERSKMLRDLFRKTRGRFTGRRVFVYHEDERNHQVEGDISRPDQIVIVGMPRMDRNHQWRRLASEGRVPVRADRPTVLVLAFLPNNFLPSYSGIDSDLAWNELCHGTYAAAARLAREYSDFDVIIRPRQGEDVEVEELLAQAGPLPQNLRVVVEGSVMPMLEASWVVCGHNTTVLLEALAINKPVVVPHFGESLDPRYAGYNVELGEAVEHAISPDDLVNRLVKHCQSPTEISEILSPAASEALAKWTGNADGKSSQRVRQALIRELSGSSNHRISA